MQPNRRLPSGTVPLSRKLFGGIFQSLVYARSEVIVYKERKREFLLSVNGVEVRMRIRSKFHSKINLSAIGTRTCGLHSTGKISHH